jgi:hypothetical protein
MGRRLDSREDILAVRTALADRVSAYDEQTMLGVTLKDARKKSNDRSISWTTVLGNLLREPTKIGLFRTTEPISAHLCYTFLWDSCNSVLFIDRYSF